MSLDGKIATSGGESRLSSPEDLKRVHGLRAAVDGIMVGVGTLLADDPKLTVKLVRGRSPQRIIVDSNARTPLDAYVVRTAKQPPTIIAASSKAPKQRIKQLERAGAVVLTCGKGHLVSLSLLLRRLRARGIERILLEGGGTLSWSMLRQGLVDEVSVAISPRILGGAEAVTLAEGEGVARVMDAVGLRLLSAKKYGTDLVLRYRVLG
jgi:2,5-diamino-6-(ribosylamino)-4(3H)-pyrimidinone 5'-phosphate reductase